MSPCPHCHAVSNAEPSPSMRWRCAVCGGPVVPDDGSFPRTHGEVGKLVGAARARAMAVGWVAAAIVLSGVAVIALPLAVLLWSAAHVAGLVLGTVAGMALALAVASTGRYRARGAEWRARLDDAWRMVADELLKARGNREVTASELALALRTDEGHAEALLSGLSAQGHARVAVGDDAQLSYRFTAEAEAEAEVATPTETARRST